MLLVLPVLSFLCAGLLAVFLIVLLRRPTVNTPNVAIVLWLLLGNTIHAVNALVWSSNVDTTRIPVWCDIVTKLLLGTTAALPGVCTCSARYLELLSSTRKIYPNTYSKRIHTLIDVALCYVLPLLYMILHFVVQDHRFDLVQNFGCSASIHRSTPAALIMCYPSSTSPASPPSTSPRISPLAPPSPHPLFIRRLAKSVLLTLTVLIFTLFPLLGPRTLSYASFHPNFNVIYVVRKPEEVTAAQTSWWAVSVVSIVYLVLSLVLGGGEDSVGVDLVSWVMTTFTRQQRPARPELTRLTFQHAMASKASLVNPTLTAPQPVQLRSGWDDMLDVKKPRQGRRPFLLNPHLNPNLNSNSNRKSAAISCSEDSSSVYSLNPAPSPTCTTPEDDSAFTSSTLTYLASPVAQALGLESPVRDSPLAQAALGGSEYGEYSDGPSGSNSHCHAPTADDRPA
ncbi:Pheromone receptor [Mycena venus]|uniref:Pheromone receptor n=1 Tax=Mycena venus TaxID=2733690 RepID=A0A8H6XN87_9AGAR|nr:Pheromone receptor [Mycena venus]